MASFSEIIGMDSIIGSLRSSIQSGRVSHAYVFDGQAGMGKSTLAKALAKTLQCEAGGTDACGSCVSCRTFESGNHPDIFNVITDKKSIGVDDIRDQVIKPMETRPYRYRYKIFIIGGADTMTMAAQNALLKTIEEPAPYGLFLLLSENYNAFLPTVISRCVVFRLKPLSEENVANYLTGKDISEDQARFYSGFSQGNIGRALRLSSSQAFTEMRETVVSLTQALRRLDMPEIFARFHVLETYKEDIQELLDLLMLWYRDVIIMKETDNARFLIQPDKKNEIYAEAQATDLSCLYKKFDAIWQAKRNLKQNGNFQLTLEMMLLSLGSG
ncbi:MAG: DNA polymerase III subunit delta' [Clostridiales bacterium]|nr:DNA polymerase III subunit delta' [Clostridiales bacterium]